MQLKSYILAVICWTSIQLVYGQTEKSVLSASQPDSVERHGDQDTVEVRVKGKKTKLEIIFEEGKKTVDQGLKEGHEYQEKPDEDLGFYGGLTFARFDLGLTKMIDGGSLILSDANDFLDYHGWKSVNVGFDVLKLGYKVSDQFRVYASAGLDWTHFRLKNDVIIAEDTAPLNFIESDVSYRKNRFSSSYIRIPLSFELSSGSEDKFVDRFRVSAGPVLGILIHGSQKFVSDENGKQKTKDAYNLAPFRYGAFARIGYGGMGVYAKYYRNDMFVNSPDQDDLKNLSFGVSFFF